MKTVQIRDKSCAHCTAWIKEALEKINGISHVEINLEKGEADYEGNVDQDMIPDTIESIGFEVGG